MLLPQTAEYALRAMAYLATRPEAEVRALDLGRETDIPAPYASKVLRRLVLEGLLVSRKGHGGGFRLARAPSQITVREVLAAADFAPTPNRCAFGWGSCNPDHPCPLHPVASPINEAFARWAGGTTLADVGPWTSPDARASGKPRRAR